VYSTPHAIWLKRGVIAALLTVSTASTAVAQSRTPTANPGDTRPPAINAIDLRVYDGAPARQRKNDSLWNGALIGAGVAIGTGLFLCTRTEPWENCRDDAGPMLRIGALGAGIGIVIDALIRDRKTSIADAGARLNIAPVVSRRTKGVQMSFSF
jgi:hypothetical protein